MNESQTINKEMIDRAKDISIVSLLKSIGIEPLKSVGKELLYKSPLRTEKSPSFFVNPTINRFNDFGGTSEMKGDCIRLAQLLWNISFIEAIKRLLGTDTLPAPSFSFSGPISNPAKGIKIISVRELQHPALIKYTEERQISFGLAQRYLKEITYECKNKRFFAVGFQNDQGGYELRNGLNFKGGKTENDITSWNHGTASAILFEGFFDFLSCLEYYGRLSPLNTTIVLNTCNNLNKALPLLSNSKMIHCYLDNDETGRKTLEKLISSGLNVKDWSSLLYPSCKDFNDFLILSRKNKGTKPC